jgi:tRNA(fMet)-specific endonuclease VapC
MWRPFSPRTLKAACVPRAPYPNYDADEATAKIFGRQRGKLRAGGLLIGDSDIWIAATALQYDLTLLTNNRRHFERIDGLRIESV